MLVLAATTAFGCQWAGRYGPVSQSLASCRQLTREGIAAMERGEQAQATAALAKAVRAYPADAEARRYYAEALWTQGASGEAVAQLEEAARLAGEDAPMRVRLAEMQLSTGQIHQARQSVERALDIDPKLASAWAVRGRVLCAAGQPRQALADYHRSLGFEPENRQLLLEMAELYRQLDQPDRALATLYNLADTYPPGEEPQQINYLAGLAHLALERYDDAALSFRTAAARDRPSAELYYLLADAEMRAGHPDAADAAARQALALQPDHPLAHRLLAECQSAARPSTRQR
jgi:Flp pilus assembly protein TadD